MRVETRGVLITSAILMLGIGSLASYSVYHFLCPLSPPPLPDTSAPPSPPEIDAEGDPGNYSNRSAVFHRLSSEEQAAYLAIANAPTFATHGVGVSGSLSNATRAYCLLYYSDSSLQIFKELAKTATPAGKAYALCALYSVVSKDYGRVLTKKAAEERRPFWYGQSCMISRHTIADLQARFLEGSLSRSIHETCSQHSGAQDENAVGTEM